MADSNQQIPEVFDWPHPAWNSLCASDMHVDHVNKMNSMVLLETQLPLTLLEDKGGHPVQAMSISLL